MKYSIVTFGCRVNQADSMAIERTLRDRGGQPAAPGEADLVVVNSCSVTATADQGTRQTIRRVARENPSARIVVTGCYATRAPEELRSLPGVARVVPNDFKEALAADTMETAARYAGADGPCGAPDAVAPSLLDRTALILRVQTGCEERCAYCIIPSTRGRSRSRPVADIVGELQLAVAAGYREVTLTGVHLGSYGRDLQPAVGLGTLLEAAVARTAIVRIRLGSLEPMDVPDGLIDLVQTGRVAPALHLPLQHACDGVLARMRRPYTLGDYARLVNDVRSRVPHAALGADVIVGFPGEDEGAFERLCAYLAGSPLTHLHVFPYSDRPGTEASSLSSKVPGPQIRARGARVREIGRALAERFAAGQAGSVRPALTIADGSVAVTDNGLKLQIPAGQSRNVPVLVRVGVGGRGELVGPLSPPSSARAAGRPTDAGLRR